MNAGLFPSVSLKNAELLLNFGETPFAFPPSKEFICLDSAETKNIVCSTHTGPKSQGTLEPLAKAPLALILEVSLTVMSVVAEMK